MNSWGNFLSQFQNELNAFNQENKSLQFDELPSGKYNVNINVASLTESKTGKPMIKFEFEVIEGPFKGRREWKYHLLEAGRIKFLMYDLSAAGLKVENMSELPSQLASLIDSKVQIEIKTNKKNGNEYRNLYIRKPLKDQSVTMDMTGQEIPF